MVCVGSLCKSNLQIRFLKLSLPSLATLAVYMIVVSTPPTFGFTLVVKRYLSVSKPLKNHVTGLLDRGTVKDLRRLWCYGRTSILKIIVQVVRLSCRY